jgi:hypothetical protein
MGISISKTIAGGDGITDVVALNIFLEDSDWFGLFDQIEVQRSRGLSTGPFEPVTTTNWVGARLPEDGGDSPTIAVTGPIADIVDRDLQLKLNETDELEVVFTDPGPGVLTYAEAAAQIQTQSAGRLLAWVDEDAKLVIETVQPGTGAALRVVGGEAAPLLGLPTSEPDSLAFGRDAHIALIKGKERYYFIDLRGDSDYFYRTRFRNRLLNTVSQFTQPSFAAQPLGVSQENLVCGRLELVGIDGRPLANVLVRVFNRFGPQTVEGKLLAGPSVDGITTEYGTLELNLVRGAEVTVAIDGTNIVRDITVPTDASVGVFNLLDPTVGPDDYWRVKHADIEYAQRRTL